MENLKKKFEELPEVPLDNEIRFDISKLNNSKFKNMLFHLDSITLSPVEYLLTGLLASLSGAIGKKVRFSFSKATKTYLNIWAVIIGRSTIMRKTTAINYCVSDIEELEIRNYKEYQRNIENYKAQNDKNKAQKDQVGKPKRDYLLLPQDSTIESLSDILSYSERGLLTHSEFGSFLAQLNRGYSADAKQFLTNIYDVPTRYEVSRVTKENLMLIRPYMSILGASTIDWIQENSKESDLRTGFFARFIYSIRNIPDKDYISLVDLNKLTKKSHQYIYTKDVFEYLSSFDNSEPIELLLTPVAKKLYRDFDTKEYLELFHCDNDNELSFKSRLMIYCLKFAGIIALSEKRLKITENDMQDAILITEYYKKNIEKLLNTEMSQTEFTRKEQRIIEIIKKKGGKIVRSDLMNRTKLKAKDLDELILNLTEKDLIESKKTRHPFNKKEIVEYRLVTK